MGFSLSVCRVHRVVEIVDCYPCDHCYKSYLFDCKLNFIPFGLSEKSFY